MTTVVQQDASIPFLDVDPRSAWLMNLEEPETTDLVQEGYDNYAFGLSGISSCRDQWGEYLRIAQAWKEVLDDVRLFTLITPNQAAITSVDAPSQLSTPYIYKGFQEGINPVVEQELVEKGWLDDAQFTLNLAKQAFSSLQCIELAFDADPEIPDWQTIRLSITVTASTSPDQVLEDEQSFRQQLHPAVSNEFYNLLAETYEWVSE